MMKNRIAPAAVFGVLVSAALVSHPAAAVPAQYQCYDFGGLAPDASYTVGDVINARHATITIKQYFTNGKPATAEARGARVLPSKIAGGVGPEMGLYLVTVNVVPNRPVTRVKMNIAQSISQTGGFANANVEVNGDKHESPLGVAAMNGKTLGQAPQGKATITANLAPAAGNWHAGTLEMHATQGGIESFSIGGHTMRLDNFCFAL